MTNEQAIETFLRSDREVKANNITTHYNEHDDENLLRQYGTLIATRKGKKVTFTGKKYSKTTTALTNSIKSLASKYGFVIEKSEEFAKGSNVNSGEIKYKGTVITKLKSNGMFEYYSDKEQRFIKSDSLSSIKEKINSESKFGSGGYVGKAEMVWGKMGNSEKIKFLYENFTPQITPRGQELLVGKAYRFLPKNVKIALNAKFANVEEYAKGSNVDCGCKFEDGGNANGGGVESKSWLDGIEYLFNF